MKVRNLSELNEFLNKEHIWRSREISNFLLVLQGARPHEQEVLRRTMMVLLYSHWEGFVKSAGKAYLSFVHGKGLPFQQLRLNFVAACVRQDLEQFANYSKSSLVVETLERFSDLSTQSS